MNDTCEGIAWRDVMPGDLVIVRPSQNRVRGQLGAVVADNRPGLAALDQETIERSEAVPR
jgi:hypothetical protein